MEKERKPSKKWERIIEIIFYTMLIIYLVYQCITPNEMYKQLKGTQGYVYKIERNGEAGIHMFYKYMVKDSIYHESVPISGMPYKIYVGDYIRIAYDSIHPERSTPVDHTYGMKYKVNDIEKDEEL